MTNKSNRTNPEAPRCYIGGYGASRTNKIIPPHGGYRKLKSYQTAEIIYDLTAEFCRRYMSYRTTKTYTRTYDQMVQAARSGKQNIAEGCQVSGTSKKTELKLIGVARGSLEELLQDFEDFLRQRELEVWSKDDPQARAVHGLAYRTNRTHKTYTSFLRKPESAANMLLTLIHQANYLLDQQLRTLEKEFLEEGGFTERLYRERVAYRNRKVLK